VLKTKQDGTLSNCFPKKIVCKSKNLKTLGAGLIMREVQWLLTADYFPVVVVSEMLLELGLHSSWIFGS
jgi:hypothetical protein